MIKYWAALCFMGAVAAFGQSESGGGGASFTNSAELAALLSDETGSGAACFATAPTLSNPSISGTLTVAASTSASIDFDDSDDAGTIDGSINVNCPTANDCDMDFAVNVGGDNETTVMKFDVTDAGVPSVVFGNGVWTSTLTMSSPITFSNSSGGLNINAADNGNLQRDGVTGLSWSGIIVAVKTKLRLEPQTLTIADSGDGNPGAGTLTQTQSTVLATCNDVHGCDVTLAETLSFSGQPMFIINEGANVVNLADTSGVSETTGAIALGQWDTASYIYATDRWVLLTTSNN